MENFAGHGNDFCVSQRRGCAQHFQTKLMEFPVPPGLGTVIPEHGTNIEHLMYLLVAVHLVFQIGTNSRGRIFRTKGHRTVSSVRKRIHFLCYHISGITDTALKKLGSFNNRSPDFLVSIPGTYIPDDSLHIIPLVHFFRQNIMGSF